MIQDINNLSVAFLKLRSEEEITAFLQDIFSPKELKSILQRWRVAKMLDEGKSYLEIERLTGASSATIAKVSEFLKYGYNGYRTALDRLKK